MGKRSALQRIFISAAFYAVLMVLLHTDVLQEGSLLSLGLFLIPYAIIGWDILYKAARNIRHGQIFDENFLMCIATFGAFGVRKYPEAVAVMLFYQVGEYFQSRAVDASRASISDLMDIYPEYATIERDGELVRVDPDDLELDDVFVVRAGERIPLDGIVLEGSSYLDTSALTGESAPRAVQVGDEIYSGCVNGSGLLRVRVTKTFENSTATKILELVENASSKKSVTENFITKFAKYYTPIVVIGAVILAIVPPLFFGQTWGEWVGRACSFLVISCPCALVISVPLGFFGGIGSASRIGVLVKGSNYFESLARLHTVVFDKTGTLTEGSFSVNALHTVSGSEAEMLELAAMAESRSSHPIAKSVCAAFSGEIDATRINSVKEESGKGIEAEIDHATIYVGNAALMELHHISYTPYEGYGTVLYVAKNQELLGYIVIADRIKETSPQAVRALKDVGVQRTVMLTGDNRSVAEAVASELGIDEVHAELLPGDKVAAVETLLSQNTSKQKLAFVGDGINDAPVLSRADVGFAMGSIGSDAAIEAADIVIMDDNIGKIASVVRIANKTMRIVIENIIFALIVKALILALGAMGIAGMWEAVFADVGVAVLAILNAMRTLRVKQSPETK